MFLFVFYWFNYSLQINTQVQVKQKKKLRVNYKMRATSTAYIPINALTKELNLSEEITKLNISICITHSFISLLFVLLLLSVEIGK